MADLLAYASVFRSAGAGAEPRTIMTRGKQFQIGGAPATNTQQFCIRPGCAATTGRPPRRVGGGGKYSKLRPQQRQHTQVAFTMPDWQQRMAGSNAAATPASRGEITTDGPSLRPEGYVSALAYGSAPASKVRPAHMTLASPAYETEVTRQHQQQPMTTSDERYARPFCAEPFRAASPGGAVGGGKGGRRYATLAVGNDLAAMTSSSSSSLVKEGGSTTGGEDDHEEEEENNNDDDPERLLPLYWYSSAPASGGGAVETAARWGGARPALDWHHKRPREAQKEEEEAMTSGGSSTEDVVARLLARVEFLEEQQRKRSRTGNSSSSTAAETEQWFASAVLGLFVICVVDAMRAS
jgi:hypothetical protein